MRKRVPRPRRVHGPAIRMTDEEYARVKKGAKKAGQSISSFIRLRALDFEHETDYTPRDLNRLRSAGRWLNQLVHRLHINPTVFRWRPMEGEQGTHQDEVEKRLAVVRSILDDLPQKIEWKWDGWGFISAVPRGEGDRRLRGRVRCTAEEYTKIHDTALMAGLSDSAFIRALMLGRPIGKASHAPLVFQLERIDNNLGQLLEIRFWDDGVVLPAQKLRFDIWERIRILSSGKTDLFAKRLHIEDEYG